MIETTMLRARTEIIEKYLTLHPEMKGLTYTAIVEVMMRKALEIETLEDARRDKK